MNSFKTILPYENMHAATNFDNAQKNCLSYVLGTVPEVYV